MLRENIDELESTNSELNRRLDLLNEADTVRLLARELSYFAPGEQAITIDSYTPRRSFYEVGRLIIMRQTRRRVRLGETIYFIPLVLLVIAWMRQRVV